MLVSHSTHPFSSQKGLEEPSLCSCKQQNILLSNISMVKIVQQTHRAYQEDLALLQNFSCMSGTVEEFSLSQV